MRVLIPALSAKGYGGDSYFRSILPELARRQDVECIIVAPDDRYASLHPGVVQVDVPMSLRGQGRVAWEQFMLPRLARRYGCSLIFTANNSGLLLPTMPCVIAVRNMEPLVPLHAGTPLLLRARHSLLAGFTRASARAAARVVAVSHFVKQAVIHLGIPEDKIDVVYHGVDDLPRPDSSFSRKGGFMAAASKFVRYANLETMLRAFAKLPYGGELRIAGGAHDHSYEREIRALVMELGLAERVRFLGYRPRDEVHALMRNADAFLFPSTLEACPFTLLEAMSQGAAVVATTAPPMPEFTSDGAILAPPRDVDSFAGAIATALRDNGLRERALRRADRFQWSHTVESLLTSWRTALSGTDALVKTPSR